jgi:hypothetical protein
MPTPYIYERQLEYWTSRGIEDFFLDNGFEVLVFPMTQLNEADIPSDFIFWDQSTKKLFGLQFKVLYKSGEDFWNVDQSQHLTLQRFDWMFYGLSDLTTATQHRTALHYLRIMRPGFTYQPHLTRGDISGFGTGGYFRWAAFYEGLRDCRWGRRISTVPDLHKSLWPYPDRTAPREITEIADEVLLSDFQNRRAIRFSSLMRSGTNVRG